MSEESKSGIPEPGWSSRANDPEILAGLERNRKAALKWGCVTVLLALAVPPAISHFVEDSLKMDDAVKMGCVIAGAIIVFSLLSKFFKSREKPYEGVVVDKREEIVHRAGKKSDTYSTEYVTYVKRTDGGKAKIKEAHARASSAWNYLKVGERFRYHPHLTFPYELYDKAKAEHLYCPVCSRANDVAADRCSRCHAPLLK